MFYTDDKSKRLKDAYKRSAVHREWIDNDARAAFEKFLWNSLQWDDEEGIMRQFRSCGVDLGPCGMVLGVSCIVNPADASQTNILMPFPILDPPIPPEDRKPWEPISLVSTIYCVYHFGEYRYPKNLVGGLSSGRRRLPVSYSMIRSECLLIIFEINIFLLNGRAQGRGPGVIGFPLIWDVFKHP